MYHCRIISMGRLLPRGTLEHTRGTIRASMWRGRSLIRRPTRSWRSKLINWSLFYAFFSKKRFLIFRQQFHLTRIVSSIHWVPLGWHASLWWIISIWWCLWCRWRSRSRCWCWWCRSLITDFQFFHLIALISKIFRPLQHVWIEYLDEKCSL